ncbi:MAG: response regulator [Saprospiraceae bacterium]|nr:response regulator [Saprospiraceae bacterium]
MLKKRLIIFYSNSRFRASIFSRIFIPFITIYGAICSIQSQSLSSLPLVKPDAVAAEQAYKLSPQNSIVPLSQVYQDLANWFRYEPQYNQDSVEFYVEKSVTLLESSSGSINEVITETYLRAASWTLQPKKKLLFLEKAQISSEKTGNNLLKYRVLFNKVNNSWAEYNTSFLAVFNQANALIENETDPSVQAELTLGIGIYYNRNANARQFALSRLFKSLDYYKQKTDAESLKSLSLIYHHLHNRYFVDGQADSAEFYLRKTEELLPQLPALARVRYESLCVTFYKGINKLDQALIHSERTLALIEQYHLVNTPHGLHAVFNAGHIKHINGDYDKAIEYYKQTLAIGDKIDMHSIDIDIWDYLAKVYEKKGDFDKALEAYKEHMAARSIRLDLNYHNATKELEIKYDVSAKEQAIAKQQAERRLLWLAIGFFILLSVILVIFYFRERRNKSIIEAQSAHLQQLDALKTRFFANVSHELRTPLTLMLAPLSTILKSGTLDNRNFTLVRLVRQNAQNLLKLVNEILDLNKLEANKLELKEDKHVVYGLIRRIVANFESSAEMQNLRFTFHYKADQYLQLMLDSDKLEKILNNLLSNAVKFTPTNGNITVNVEEENNYLKITVSDTGRGIHPDDLPHIFNRFYQSSQTDALIEGGTGIGLSLSSELAKLMGGTLTAQSTLGKGSVFVFNLPKKEILGTAKIAEGAEDQVVEVLDDFSTDEMSPSVLTAQMSNNSHRKTILIVEDNKSLREYLTLILEPHYQIKKAENGQIALDLLNKKADIDLILSDVMMPVMDGFQLLSSLKTQDTFCSIPFVMLTARAEMQDKLKALRIGVDDYLIKPFEEDELIARIENLLRNVQFRHVFTKNEEVLGSEHANEVIADDKNDTNTEGEVLIEKPKISVIEMAWLAELEVSVMKNLHDIDYSVERMASDMALSRTQLFRKLKQLAGLSPQQYLQEVRLNHALHLLETQQVDSVKAACYAVGLLQVKHFSQLFQERFGKLPSTYL